MKILITGGSGLLGQYLNKELSKSNKILTIYNSHEGNCKEFPSAKADITGLEELSRLFDQFRPDLVIHTAAFTAAILPELIQPKKLYDLNVVATKNIAVLCAEYKSKLIYTSTDLVYAGYRGSMLKEDAKLIPASLYAETKLMGEVKIRETFDDYLILRIALLFGFGLNHSRCHFQQMYINLKEGKKIKLFYDQFRTPVSIPEVAGIINDLIRLNIKGEIFNLGGLERVSRVELGERLCRIEGFDENLIEKISMNELPGLPPVADVSMNTEKLQSFGIKLKDLDDSIKEILEN